MKTVFLALVVFVFLFGCAQPRQAELGPDFGARPGVDRATILCQKLCSEKKAQKADFSAGPCLSNEIIPNWVCDIAHFPRQGIDDEPENQCSAFREGKAKHFVELDADCEVIKTN